MLARRAGKKDASRMLAVQAARVAHDNNAEGVTVLDLRGISPVTDYFVICTGSSSRQMRSVAEDIVERGRSLGQNVWHVAGVESGDWIVLDFVDVVVHVFDDFHRRHYDLELIWGEAPRVRWKQAAARRRSE